MADGISKQALARKKAFLKAKEEAGGSVEMLMEKSEKRDWTLYFDKSGNIVCLTQEVDEIDVKEDWITYDFNLDQLGILLKKDVEISNYWIVKDLLEENVYKIELKPTENIYANAEKDFLYEIDSELKKAQITVTVSADALTVVLDRKIVEENYSDMYPVSATVNGARMLKFFITAPGNPHVMYHSETISLSELIIHDEVVRPLPADCRQYSVYTIKHFDTYLKTK
jgi:hypothetical protein